MPKIVPDGTNAVRLLSMDRSRPPSQNFFPSITVQRDPANTGALYVGWPTPNGVGGAVSSTNYDAILGPGTPASGEPGVTLDGDAQGTFIDASLCWVRPAVSGEGGSWYGGVKS
jgi:hypothetical protein